MRGRAITLFAFLLFFNSCSTLSSKKKTEKKSQLIYHLALSSLRQCRYPQALKQLLEALKLEESDPSIYHSLALVYFQLKQYPLAVKFFKKALQLQPGWTVARVDLGRSLIETGQIQEALHLLKKASKDLSYPYPENIHAHMGLSFFKRKNFKEAQMHFEVARQIQGRDCELALYHAQSLYFLKKYNKAGNILEPSKRWCQRAFLPPCATPHFKAYFWQALVYDKQGQHQKALKDLKVFLKNSNKKHPLYFRGLKVFQRLRSSQKVQGL